MKVVEAAAVACATEYMQGGDEHSTYWGQVQSTGNARWVLEHGQLHVVSRYLSETDLCFGW